MNQIDHYQQPSNNAELMPMPGQSAGTQALQNLEAQAQAMGNAMRIAEAMCSTEMVPKQYRNKPADGAAAILYGAELGLGAIQSLQQVMVINGKPGVEARTMVALLRNHGFTFDVPEDTNTAVTVIGESPTGETHTSRWTLDDAKTAGYTSNKLYQQIPRTMLYAKAATEVCRRLGSHILSGIAYSTEELQLQPVKAQAVRTDRQRGGSGVMAALSKAKQPTPEPEAAQVEPGVPTLEEVQQAAGMDELSKLMAQVSDALDGDDYEPYRLAANTRAAELQEGEQA